MTAVRSLIMVFDAFRPDGGTPALMPSLYRFQSAQCRFRGRCCIFPGETRVNAAALATGCTAGRHGVGSHTSGTSYVDGGGGG